MTERARTLFLGCAALLMSLPETGSAFPEMTRHGYPSCTTCHVSPSGGGVLTPYGRALSAEVMSTWGDSDEGGLLHGAVSLPDMLRIGGDIRALQMHQETSSFQQGRFILMQADIEAALETERWSIAATIGRQAPTSATAASEALISRRHFLSFRPTPRHSLRVGRFLPAYGIYFPDHTVAVRQRLGRGEGSETYNLEFSWAGETLDVFATAVFGRPSGALAPDAGVALRAGYGLGEASRLGLSYYYNAAQVRHRFGPWAVIGFTEKLYLLAEWDFQQTATRWGFVHSARLGYEILQGLHFYAIGDGAALETSSHGVGAGIQFFPRPHFELIGQYQHRLSALGGSDLFWLMGHYYL